MRDAAFTRGEPELGQLRGLVDNTVRSGSASFSEELMEKTERVVSATEAPSAELLRALRMSDIPGGRRTDLAPAIFSGRPALILWLLDNAWWITLLIIAAVIVFVGYQTQFIDDPSFEGDAADYVQLIAWALAIQVAGGTIIETVGKLRTSRPSA